MIDSDGKLRDLSGIVAGITSAVFEPGKLPVVLSPEEHNDDPRPFVRTKPDETILVEIACAHVPSELAR